VEASIDPERVEGEAASNILHDIDPRQALWIASGSIRFAREAEPVVTQVVGAALALADHPVCCMLLDGWKIMI